MRVILFVVLLLATLTAPLISRAQQAGGGMMSGHGMMFRGMPYGQLCPGPGSRPYGAPKPVKTAKEARQLVENYCMACGRRLHCGRIEEKDLYFEADMLNSDGSVIDKVIIDKRTGRIRSIY